MKIITGLLLISSIGLLQACSDKETEDTSTKANFAVSGYDKPAPSAITFFNSSTNATSYKWYFGDGATSTEFSPTHTYPAIGTYTMKLVATGPSGTDSVCKVLYLGDVQAGQSSFSYFINRCDGVPASASFVSLNPQSSNYAWDFGNGVTALDKSPLVVFASTGAYLVTFSSQVGGVRDTTILGITVN